ncbi:MAG: hypothetical protein QM750_05395 [Rubrivivax sp.]
MTAPARTASSSAWPLALALALAAAAAPLRAETASSSPYWLSLAQSAAHDSNVLRLTDSQQPPGGLSRADSIYTTALTGGLDQSFGRQRLNGTATVQHTHYGDNTVYDGLGYTLRLGLDWATVNRLSGSLALGASRAQRPNLRDLGDAVITTGNDESVRFLDGRAVLGQAGRLQMELSYGHRSLRYDAAASRFRNFDQDSFGLGVRRGFSDQLQASIGLRRVLTDYPFLLTGLADPLDRRRRNEIGLDLSWRPSGSSRLAARLAQGRTRHEQLGSRDFNATTGRLEWQWDPGGRLSLSSRLSRDAGQDDSVNSSVFSRTTDVLGLNATYRLTGKTTLGGRLDWIRRTQQGSGGDLEGIRGRDTGSALALDIRWTPTRNSSLGCRIGRERRGPNVSPAINEAFHARSLGCSAQIALQ